MSVRALSPRGEDSCRCGWRVAPPGHCRPVRGSARSTLWGWCRQGRQREERTHTHKRLERFGRAWPLVRVGPAKKSNALWRAQDVLLLQQVCHPCPNGADVAQFNPHRSHAKAPFAGPQTLRASCFALSPQSAFCIRSTSQPGCTTCTQQPTAVGVHGGSV